MSRRTPLGPPLVIRNRGQEGRESTSRARSSSSSGCLPARCGLIALRVETAVLRMATGGIPPRRVIWSTGRKRRRCALTLMSVRVSSRLVATAPFASVVGLWARKRSIQVLRAHLKVSRSMRRSS